jgi:hypothetical protein
MPGSIDRETASLLGPLPNPTAHLRAAATFPNSADGMAARGFEAENAQPALTRMVSASNFDFRDSPADTENSVQHAAWTRVSDFEPLRTGVMC